MEAISPAAGSPPCADPPGILNLVRDERRLHRCWPMGNFPAEDSLPRRFASCLRSPHRFTGLQNTPWLPDQIVSAGRIAAGCVRELPGITCDSPGTTGPPGVQPLSGCCSLPVGSPRAIPPGSRLPEIGPRSFAVKPVTEISRPPSCPPPGGSLGPPGAHTVRLERRKVWHEKRNAHQRVATGRKPDCHC